MDHSHGNDLAGAADTELTLRFPGDPPPGKSRRRRCDHEMSLNVNGWPPVRGRNRKKSTEDEEDDECLMWYPSCVLMVKVAADGAPFLRKVDLEAFSTYQELLRALLEMFSSCFTIPPPPPIETGIKEEEEGVNKVLVMKGIEYIPTYEDKDGDWMLLGDVPWEMFKQSCKRIRLVKSSS